MGGPIATKLVRAVHRVRVWNRSRSKVDPLVKLGAIPVATARDAFVGDAVFSMLADDNAVREVIEPLLDGAPRGLVHVNLATVSVAYAREIAARHQARGVSYVAATVFGRPDVAATGQLTLIVAGDSAAIECVQPMFDVIGHKTWHIGTEPQRANAVKLAGDFMLGATVDAMAEAASMVSRNGVSPAEVLEILDSLLDAAWHGDSDRAVVALGLAR